MRRDVSAAVEVALEDNEGGAFRLGRGTAEGTSSGTAMWEGCD